jgi:hypothetical protein
VDAPQKIHFVCELCGGEEGVTAVVGEVYAVFLLGFGEDVTMFGGVVEGSDDEAKLSFCASILK